MWLWNINFLGGGREITPPTRSAVAKTHSADVAALIYPQVALGGLDPLNRSLILSNLSRSISFHLWTHPVSSSSSGGVRLPAAESWESSRVGWSLAAWALLACWLAQTLRLIMAPHIQYEGTQKEPFDWSLGGERKRSRLVGLDIKKFCLSVLILANLLKKQCPLR